MRAGSHPVIVIRDPDQPEKPMVEPTSGISAGKRMELKSTDLPPEWNSRIMDLPFVTLDEMADLLQSVGVNDSFTDRQKELRDELNVHVVRAYSRAYKLFMAEPEDRHLRASQWLAFTSQCMAAVTTFEALRRTRSEEEERRAKKALRLRDRQEKGRTRDKEKRGYVLALRNLREQGKQMGECISELVRCKALISNDLGDKLTLESGKEMTVKAFSKWYTEAGRKNPP